MEKKIIVPFAVQIVAILLVGVIVSGIVWMSMNGSAERTELTMNVSEKYQVTFAEQDGTIIEVKEVSEGKGVFPPEYPCEGVFRGWSGRFNQVVCDVEVHPMVHNIAEQNLFYFNSAYVQEGTDFVLDICLGGDVCVSSGELTILYDPAVLQYTGERNSSICDVTEAGAGKLTIKFSSESRLTEHTVLAQLTFVALEKDAYATEIQLIAGNVLLLSKGKLIPANYATINNKIYFLQEVG